MTHLRKDSEFKHVVGVLEALMGLILLRMSVWFRNS